MSEPMTDARLAEIAARWIGGDLSGGTLGESALLIRLAHRDVSDLLAEVKRLREERDDWEGQLEALHSDVLGLVGGQKDGVGTVDTVRLRLDSLNADIATLRAQVEADGKRFREYEAGHRTRANGARIALNTATPSERRALAASIEHRSEKAASNAAMAEACERVLDATKK